MTDIKDLSKKLREMGWRSDLRPLIDQALDELDRLIEVEKVLKQMCGDLRDKFDELRGEEYLSGKGSNILHDTVDEYLERADEIGKSK